MLRWKLLISSICFYFVQSQKNWNCFDLYKYNAIVHPSLWSSVYNRGGMWLYFLLQIILTNVVQDFLNFTSLLECWMVPTQWPCQPLTSVLPPVKWPPTQDILQTLDEFRALLTEHYFTVICIFPLLSNVLHKIEFYIYHIWNSF